MARYWEWSNPFKIDPKETALIIVDMQKGFVDEGHCFFTPQAHEQIPLMVFRYLCPYLHRIRTIIMIITGSVIRKEVYSMRTEAVSCA